MKTMKIVMGVVCALTLGTGCVLEETEAPEEPMNEELAETSSALTIGGHYCVDQSYASAERLGGYSNVCWRSPIWSTTLSNGHKVTAVTNCGDFSSAYAIVYSHWNSAYYYMRKDALRPC